MGVSRKNHSLGEAVNLSHRSRWKSDHGCE
jgi:hypothetical protein